jgi:hypothetical protein
LTRSKPREQPRPEQDAIYNTMIAICRITVEHSIGRLRWHESLKQVDRHHRENVSARRRAARNEANFQLCQPTMPKSRVRGVVGVRVFADVCFSFVSHIGFE